MGLYRETVLRTGDKEMSRNVTHEIATSSIDQAAVTAADTATATSFETLSIVAPTDMPDMSVTMSIAVGTNVKVLFTAALTVDTPSYLDLYIVVDGSIVHQTFYYCANNNEKTISIERFITVTPGTRTFKIRWAVRNIAYTARVYDRSLTIIEMKR